MLPDGGISTWTTLIAAQSMATHGIPMCHILQAARCSKGRETEAREEQKLIPGHTAGIQAILLSPLSRPNVPTGGSG